MIQWHAYYDKSYDAEVKQYTKEQPWLRTRPHGYDHDGNESVARAIRMMRGQNRTLLLAATWGQALSEAASAGGPPLDKAGQLYPSHAGKETPV